MQELLLAGFCAAMTRECASRVTKSPPTFSKLSLRCQSCPYDYRRGSGIDGGNESDKMEKQDYQRRRLEQTPSLQDYFLRPWFRFCVFALRFTVLRLILLVLLAPIYRLVQSFRASRNVMVNSKLLLSSQGRTRLVHLSEQERQHQRRLATRQANGSYQFPAHDLITNPPHLKAANWLPRRETIQVCGAKVRVVHEKPKRALESGQKILLCHGKASWSYVWRNVRANAPLLVHILLD